MVLTSPYKTASGLQINPAHFDPDTDVAGELTPSTSDQLTSASDFATWYRDTQGVNMSVVMPLTFNRVPGTNRYLFDSAQDEPYKSRGGFWPLDGELFGEYKSSGHNFHFTTEITANFMFERDQNHVFTFTGDDDVWVFINGRLVLDLGGLHPRREQSLELNDLAWLEDKRVHQLKVFHAERHTVQSNFRIETTLQLRKVQPPATTGLYD